MRRYIILVTAAFLLLLFLASPMRQIYAPLRYRELVKHYAQKYDLDWLLVSSIIYHESRFRYRAESNKGARGLMQIMPDTGCEIAKKMGIYDFTTDMLFRPIINLDLGCYYFSKLLKEFNNDIRIALAAYNSGKGSVYRSITDIKNGTPFNDSPGVANSSPGNSISYFDIQKYLYPETRKYVSRVNSTYKLLKFLNKIWKL